MRHYSYLHLGNQVLVLRKRYHDAVVFKHDASLLGMVEVVAVVVKEASAYTAKAGAYIHQLSDIFLRVSLLPSVS
jgi:hypothetical protein